MSPAKASDPVGIFDSGIGGLSVLQEIRALLPREDLCYVADSAYMPYGEKPRELVRERSLKIARFLVDEQRCKAVVVACNTATGIAVELLREKLEVPVIAIEPAIKPAAELTRSGVIGVIATPGTISGEKFGELHSRFSRDTRIISQPCPGLAREIESGNLKSIRLRKLLMRFIRPLVDQQADTIVLGCTHYPFIKPLIQELTGPDVTIIDSGEAVARQLRRRLQETGLLNDMEKAGYEKFWCSNPSTSCASSVALLTGVSDIRELPL